MNFVSTNARVFGGQFLTEEEYATFLAWPSDSAVIRLMRRHDIEWVFVPLQPWKWVRATTTCGCFPNHRTAARYIKEMEESASFCLGERESEARLSTGSIRWIRPGRPRRSRDAASANASSTGR